MPRYVAFLRGVSPLNCRMPDVKRCFEGAGFAEVRTLLSSGNVIFNARKAATAALERKVERVMAAALGRSFLTFVRPAEDLRSLIESDPYASFTLAPGSKRVLTFLRRQVEVEPPLPIERDGARILKVEGREVISAYVPGPKGPVFMALIERTFGSEVTTRTWNTVGKCVKI